MEEHRKARVSRRGALKLAVALAGAALLPAGRSAAADSKLPKAEANYQDQPKNSQRCSACTHFIPPGQCRLVEGSISPNGWCRFFSPKA